MDILLAHGYHLDDDPHEQAIMKPYPPLGLLGLSAFLRSRDVSVEVYDGTFEPRESFRRALGRVEPRVVGIYVNLMTKLRALEMIREARTRGAHVILGGPEPPFYASEYLEHGADVVVFGEGEQALMDLLAALEAKGPHRLHDVPGIAFRDESGEIVRTAPRPAIASLDALPFPDREAVDMAAYLGAWRRHHGRTSVSLICARGCPYHCDWCSHSVYGNTHRRRSPRHVADEVELIHDRYAPDQLWYADDVFTIKPSWTLAYGEELSRRGLHLPFECISRADRLDDTVVETLARMGCFRVWIGSESGSQRILDGMQRGVTVERVQAASRACRARGIEVGMFIMLGYEGEEHRDLEATVAHLKRSEPDVVLTTVAYPIRGTGYHDKVLDRIQEPVPWGERTDRDLVVRGRHSKRYYESAMRWISSEVSLHREAKGRRRLLPMAKAGANWLRGRVGMAWTSREVEA